MVTEADKEAARKAAADRARFAIENAKRSSWTRRKPIIEKQFDDFISVIERTSAKNPNIKQEAFRAISDEFYKERENYMREVEALHMESPDTHYTNVEVRKLRDKYHQKIHDKVFRDHGKQGEAAWEAIKKELQPESIFTSIIKMFYNSDKGGFQWGASLLAGVGGYLGYKFTAGSGTLINILATVGIGAIAAYAGSKWIDGPDKPLANVPDFHKPKGDPKAKGTGPVVHLDKDKMPGVEKPEGIYEVTHHNPVDSFQAPARPAQVVDIKKENQVTV